MLCGAFEVKPLPVVGRKLLASNKNIKGFSRNPEIHPAV
jgi:hypothetical protein